MTNLTRPLTRNLPSPQAPSSRRTRSSRALLAAAICLPSLLASADAQAKGFHEIITIHVGSEAVELGGEYWAQLVTDYGIQTDGQMPSDSTIGLEAGDGWNVYFSETGAGKHVPRAVFVDLAPDPVAAIRTGTYRQLFNPNQLISESLGCTWTMVGKVEEEVCVPPEDVPYAEGYYGLGADVVDTALSSVAVQVAKTSSLAGFRVISSADEGVGSGLGSLLLSRLASDYPGLVIQTHTVLPTRETLDGSAVSTYNTLFALRALSQYPTMSYTYGGDAETAAADLALAVAAGMDSVTPTEFSASILLDPTLYGPIADDECGFSDYLQVVVEDFDAEYAAGTSVDLYTTLTDLYTGETYGGMGGREFTSASAAVAAVQESYADLYGCFDDTDGDGLTDDVDLCPDEDATGWDLDQDGCLDDSDGDGVTDDLDLCPQDYTNDSDDDGICDSEDFCPFDADDDADGDGLCADEDLCPLDGDNDLDNDGICGDVDLCPLDSSNDADGDGVCGNVDICDLGDDTVDSDGDGTPDACDVCAFDAANDADSDGLCADEDACPYDGDNDLDGDTVCGDEDLCPLDFYDDSDLDGSCDSDDVCPVDPENDADGDGLCESVDNCATVANASQDDADGDDIGDACEPDDDGDGVSDDDDNCPMDVNADQADTDADGAGDVCDADDDNDGVMDGEDACLSTPSGEAVLDNGCSLDEACPCEGDWKNHGAYESCVASSLKDLRKAGLISGSAARALGEASEDNECGKTSKGRKHRDGYGEDDYEDEDDHECSDKGHRHDERRHR